MRRLFILLMLLILPASAFAQTAKEFFLNLPKEILKIEAQNRPDLITYAEGDLLKFALSESGQGELKVVSQSKDETLLGISVHNCDQSSLRFWRVKKGDWKETTNSTIQPLGKKDVIAILEAFPATITDLNQTLEIGYFYKFAADSSNLQLIARKQDSCDIAGTVYKYKFNGKKYVIQK